MLRLWVCVALTDALDPLLEALAAGVHGREVVCAARRVGPRADADQGPGVPGGGAAHRGAAGVALPRAETDD